MRTRQKLERCSSEPRKAQDCWKPAEARKARKDSLLEAPERSGSTDFHFILWSLRLEIIHFCCSKPSGLLSLVTTAQGNQCITLTTSYGQQAHLGNEGKCYRYLEGGQDVKEV